MRKKMVAEMEERADHQHIMVQQPKGAVTNLLEKIYGGDDENCPGLDIDSTN